MFRYISIIYFIIVVIPIIITIIYDKRDPIKSLSWIIVVAFIPFAGSILYLCFGQNLRKRKLFNKKYLADFQHSDYIVSRQMYQINSPFFENESDTIFFRDIGTLLLNSNHAPIFNNSAVDLLSNGEECFNAIKRAILDAKQFIHFEFYIVRDDKIGNEIADLLIYKATHGVEVRMIYDDVGCWSLPKSFAKRLRENGVKIFPFMPVYFPLLTSTINYRNHRKIIVVDGLVGFTGGMNVADKYIDGVKNLGKWRDIHLKIEGSSVATLQRIFMSDWAFVSGEKLNVSTKYFPYCRDEKNGIATQIASSGPDSDWATIMQAFFAAITKAKESIYITTPYFLPNEPILTALKVAALSGIDIKLIIPGKSDSKLVFWATRSFITELLTSGVKIFFYREGFIHSKLIIIDGCFSGVGSANMDTRSFEDNFEVTAFIYDKDKCSELENIFFEDISDSRQIYLRWWRTRPLIQRFYESVSRLLSPLL